jgi:hypothetical protein
MCPHQVSLDGLGKVASDYLQVSNFRSFYCLDLLKYLKRGALKRLLEIYLFKTQVDLELRRLLGSFDQKGKLINVGYHVRLIIN